MYEFQTMAVLFTMLYRSITFGEKSNLIHFNLCIALLIALIVFLVGGIWPAKEDDVSYIK